MIQWFGNLSKNQQNQQNDVSQIVNSVWISAFFRHIFILVADFKKQQKKNNFLSYTRLIKQLLQLFHAWDTVIYYA